MFLPILLFCSLPSQISATITYRLFNSPNYRDNSTYPPNANVSVNINNLNSNDSWVIANIPRPAGWIQTNVSIGLGGFVFNGTQAVAVDFVAIEDGGYMVELELDFSTTNTSTINWLYNATYRSDPNPTNISTYLLKISNLPTFLTAGPQSFYIWLDQGIILNGATIIHQRPVSITLQHSPSNLTLYITTDIPLAYCSDPLALAQSISVILLPKPNLSSICLKSNGSQTNPAHWAGYTNVTDFGNLSAGYIKTPSTRNNTHLTIQVKPIEIDCTVDVALEFNDSNAYLTDSFHTIFIEDINTTIQLTEVIKSVTVNYSLLYFIPASRLYVYFWYNNVYNTTDYQDLNTLNVIKIDNIKCNITSISNNNPTGITQFHIPCKNNSQFLWTSNVSINIPIGYFREPWNRTLYNFTLNQIKRQYVLDASINVTVKYYQKEQILAVIYEIKIQNSWKGNLSTNSTLIKINNVNVPWNVMKFVPNIDNFIEVQASLSTPLIANDNVTVDFYQSWDNYNTVQGYHRWWNINAGYTVMRLPNKPIPATLATQIARVLENARIPTEMTIVAETGWNLLIFGYFINNFIAFQNLVFMYYFIGFKNVVNVYRKQLAKIILMINQQTNYQQLLSKFLKSDISLYIIHPQFDYIQTIQPQYQALSFQEAQYSSDFLQSSFENLVLIFLVFVKLAIIRILIAVLPCSLGKSLLARLYSYGPLLVLFEILMAAPQIYVLFGIYIKPQYDMGYEHYLSKLNFGLVMTMGYICLMAVFFIFHMRFQTASAQTQAQDIKTSTNLQSESIPNNRNKMGRNIVHMLDNMLYVVVPFLAGAGNSTIFTIGMTLITTLRLSFLIRKRKYFSRIQLVKQTINKCLWFLFNLIYIFYWLTQIIGVDCTQGSFPQALAICDIAESCLLLGGCLFEMAINFLSIIYSIVVFIKSLINKSAKNSIHHHEQSANKSQTKNMATVQNFPVVNLETQYKTPKKQKQKLNAKQIYKLSPNKDEKILVKSVRFKKSKPVKVHENVFQNKSDQQPEILQNSVVDVK